MPKLKLHWRHEGVPNNTGPNVTAACFRRVSASQCAAFPTGVGCKQCQKAMCLCDDPNPKFSNACPLHPKALQTQAESVAHLCTPEDPRDAEEEIFDRAAERQCPAYVPAGEAE